MSKPPISDIGGCLFSGVGEIVLTVFDRCEVRKLRKTDPPHIFTLALGTPWTVKRGDWWQLFCTHEQALHYAVTGAGLIFSDDKLLSESARLGRVVRNFGDKFCEAASSR